MRRPALELLEGLIADSEREARDQERNLACAINARSEWAEMACRVSLRRTKVMVRRLRAVRDLLA